jgi:ABC-type multidrug transport system fused ATPase/permease subunit
MCTQGTISTDGHVIKDVTLKAARSAVPGSNAQDSIQFNDTVAVNVALSKQNATDEEV